MPLRDDLRRRLPRARWLAKQGLVQADLFKHRNDPAVRAWRPVLVGARFGHVVVPSVALESSRQEASDFAQRGLVRPGDRVFDVGGGNGRQAIGLLEHGVASYVGLEVVRGSVEFANRAFREHPSVHFDFFDVRNEMYNPGGRMPPEHAVFPYESGSFDFAVALSLYTHLERIEVVARYVAETARVLQDEGTAFMSFFRSPPNAPTASAVRSVFPEGDILRAVGEHFSVLDAAGGATIGFHDQWRLYLQRRA